MISRFLNIYVSVKIYQMSTYIDDMERLSQVIAYLTWDCLNNTT